MSQATLAGLAGRSQSWLSKVEQGLLPLERRTDLVALADALHVSPVDLTGQPYEMPHTTAGADPAASIPAIRRALQDAPDQQHRRPVDQLLAEVGEVTARRLEMDLVSVSRMLPGLLTGLKAAQTDASRTDRPRLLKGAFWASHAAQSAARNLGYLDLGWIAAEQVAAAAHDLGDPTWVAAAEFSRAHALLPSGSYRTAHRSAAGGADTAMRLPGEEAAGAAGALMLAASIAAASTGDTAEAEARLDAAAELADRPTGRTFAHGFAFGRPNVMLHRMAVAIELGRPEDVQVTAAQIVDEIPGMAPERQASYWLDVGRAYAQLHRDAEAVAAFRTAEELAPLRVRLHPLVRESVAGMVTRAHQAAVGRHLRGLAYRMGVPH